MKVLAITNLFPDTTRPGFAEFNRQQLYHLASRCELTVIVPVPWTRRLMKGLAGKTPGPPGEFRGRAVIEYPTYYYTPKILRGRYGAFYLRSISGAVSRAFDRGRPDVIYATWAYPDCWAAVKAGDRMNVPVVSRLHGSDINDYMRYPDRRRLILEALEGSARVVSVSADLRKKLAAAGVDEGRIEVLRNGVDRSIFRPSDRAGSRRALGLPEEGRIVLFAGNLNAGKGVDLLIEAAAAADVESLSLHILGDGPAEGELRAVARGAGVHFHGRQPLERVAAWMNAADIFCLPSYDEGMPNVILEALSCATPVVATDTGGIPEIVDPSSGLLFSRGDAADLSRKLEEALARDWDREAIDPPAGSWDENAGKLLSILSSAVR